MPRSGCSALHGVNPNLKKKTNKLISNKKELVELFNQKYINIVENSSGKKPSSLGDCLNASQDNLPLKKSYYYIVTILAFKK